MFLRRGIKITPGCTTTHGRYLLDRVDPDRVYRREIKHLPVIDDRQASGIVAAAANRNLQPLLSGKVHGSLHIGHALAEAAIYAIFGFLMVVFCFWGVNFLLSGLHAYA